MIQAEQSSRPFLKGKGKWFTEHSTLLTQTAIWRAAQPIHNLNDNDQTPILNQIGKRFAAGADCPIAVQLSNQTEDLPMSSIWRRNGDKTVFVLTSDNQPIKWVPALKPHKIAFLWKSLAWVHELRNHRESREGWGMNSVFFLFDRNISCDGAYLPMTSGCFDMIGQFKPSRGMYDRQFVGV